MKQEYIYDIYDLIRKRIQEIRRRKNLTAKEVAERAGIPVSSYAAIETGARHLNLHRLSAIVSALNVDILEVWPQAWDARIENPLAAALPEVGVLNWFRFREIFVISGATSGCLISKTIGSIEVLYAINATEKEQKQLLSGIKRQDKIPEWEILSREERHFSLHLALKNAFLSPFGRRLAKLYLSMWISARKI